MAHCVQQARSLEEVKGARFVIFFLRFSNLLWKIHRNDDDD